MQVTLVLTRTPLKEFRHGHRSGRWGELIAIKGPKVNSVKLLPKSLGVGANPLMAIAGAMQSASLALAPVAGVVQTVGVAIVGALQDRSSAIPVGNGMLELSTSGGPIVGVKRFTSMERFKADSGNGYYVQLRPKPNPYWITFENGNSAVKKLRPGHDGRCFRVHGGRPGPEQGILIHEAPQVGWVIGCISPRPLNNFEKDHRNADGNPSHKAMEELFAFVGKRADLFVLDW